jgi:hypothetical protein
MLEQSKGMYSVSFDSDTETMLGEYRAESEGQRNKRHPRRRTMSSCTVVSCIDNNTIADYINFIHIKKREDERLLPEELL